jgi:hypothetical protein
MMSDNDQVVRAVMASALGSLGPQAAAAIPALEKALEEAQIADPPGGFRTGIHLDDVIQAALEKIRRQKKRLRGQLNILAAPERRKLVPSKPPVRAKVEW